MWAHWAFYVVILLIVASGIGTALFTGLIEIVFQGSGAPLPEYFDDVPPLDAHEFRAAILFLLVIGHVVAALYHQYWLKDGLFSRMRLANGPKITMDTPKCGVAIYSKRHRHLVVQFAHC